MGLLLKWRTRRHPHDAQASAVLAEAHLVSGDIEAARAAAKAGLAVVRRVRVAHRLADVLRRSGQVQGALDAYQRAVELAPDSGAAHLALGQFALQFKRTDLACSALSRASALLPGDADLLRLLGEAHLQAGNYPDAVFALRLAVELGHPDLRTTVLLGRAASAAGDGQLAITMLSGAAERAPDRLDVHLALSKYVALHDSQHAALALLTSMLHTWPGSPEVLQNMAVAHAELGYFVEALDTIAAAIAARPDQPLFERNRGAILFRAGRFAEAARSFEALTRRMPENAEAHLLFAKALHRVRRLDRARAEADKAIELAGQSPTGDQARALRERLAVSSIMPPIDDPNDPRIILSGTIERAPITQLMEFARTNATTGRLVISSNEGVAELTLGRGGMLWSTCTNSPNLGDRLVERGWVERAVFTEHDERHRISGDPRPIGRHLVDAQLITEEQLQTVRREQIYAVIRMVMRWTSGTFSLLRSDTEPDASEPTMRIDYLLLDVMRMIDEEEARR